MTVSDCPFCRIVLRYDNASIVHETEHCLAFLPFSPATRGHTLVIPKAHAENIYDIDVDMAASVIRLAVRLAGVMRSLFEPEGLTLVNSTGAVATQSVPHFHFHVVPRWTDDEVTLKWPEQRAWAKADLDDMAGLIGSALGR
jgi:histidine triad (HIT) family protein